jgi:hypothetical protein
MPAKVKRPSKPTVEAKCFNCGDPVDQDNFCHGCEHYVCDACDQRQYTGRMGPHDKSDHLIGDDDDEDVEDV